jgi:hypothetical protein
MRRARPAILLLLLGACTGAPAPRPAPSAAARSTPDPSRPLPLPLPEVVARVNGQPIRIQQILPIAKSALDKWKGAEREQHKPEVAAHGAPALHRPRAAAAGGAEPRRPGGHAQVDWSYDQLRREHKDDAGWAKFLLEQAPIRRRSRRSCRASTRSPRCSPTSRAACRSRRAEVQAAYDGTRWLTRPTARTEPPPLDSVRGGSKRGCAGRSYDELQTRLLERLRAHAKIELYL